MTESLSVPRSVLRELRRHARQIEEIIAALEQLADREGIRGTKTGLRQYGQGEDVLVGDPKQLDSLREGQRMVPETFEPPRTYPEFAAVAVKH